ncbi:MAG: ABC-F family ATP-binding cassette domain-containing protein, partial [Bacteroidetes bacterium]|nr:ABC-F family ATP-binding cassette domain-containing protein [Bacteroidota bacterium]
LDEPTNHLDIEMIEWLEKYLSQSHITFIMVTHDRYFLDRVCNHIMELSYGNLYTYTGNYTSFLQQKLEREDIERTEVDKARKLMKKEQEWISRMPKARTTKSKARIDSFERTKEKAHSLRTEQQIKLQVNHTRIGGKILEMSHVTKSYGDLLLIDNFSYLFKKGERIGIVGKNGIGKSTFLKLITEQIKADSGIISSGDTIVYGHYSQDGIQIKEDQRVIDVVKEIAEIIPQGKEGSLTASQLLQLFMFTAEMQNQVVALLSGGERRRLYLLTVLIKNPNFLILDEPTNDLDLMTLYKLEEFLVNYKGCLLLVSHDRYFLDHTIDHLFVFEGEGSIRDFPGNYSQYRASLDQKDKKLRADIKEEKKKIVVSGPQQQNLRKKLTFSERKEYEQLEKEIELLEKEKETLISFMDSGTHDYEKLTESSERISTLIQLIDDKMMRWLELEEMA